jgi:hypothetical protein
MEIAGERGVALATGAARGSGYAIASALVENGVDQPGGAATSLDRFTALRNRRHIDVDGGMKLHRV